MTPPRSTAARVALPPEGAGPCLGRPSAAGAMRLRVLITITMPDGSRGQHMGFYAHVIDAVVRAMDYFPDARRISGRPA